MKKKLIICLFALGTLAMQAQEAPRERPAMDATAQTEKLSTELGLSEDQKSKVLSVLTEARQKRKEARANSNGDRAAMMAQIKEIEQNKDNQLKGILTDDQYKKYEELKAERKAQRGKN